MRQPCDYLSGRELFVLENHPKMSYQKIGEIFGITGERVRQIKVHAERVVREEKRRDNARVRAAETVQLTLTRKDLWIIRRGLRELSAKYTLVRADMRRKHYEPDPDEERIDTLLKELEEY